MANSQDNSRYYSLLAATPARPDMEEASEIEDLVDDPDLYDPEIPDTPDANTPYLEFGSADFDQGNFKTPFLEILIFFNFLNL
jgi:hypothetical protein